MKGFELALVVSVFSLLGCSKNLPQSTTDKPLVERQKWGIYSKIRMPDGMICYTYDHYKPYSISCSKDFEWETVSERH